MRRVWISAGYLVGLGSDDIRREGRKEASQLRRADGGGGVREVPREYVDLLSWEKVRVDGREYIVVIVMGQTSDVQRATCKRGERKGRYAYGFLDGGFA